MAGITQYTDVVLAPPYFARQKSKGGDNHDTERLEYDSSCSVRLMEADKQVLQQ